MGLRAPKDTFFQLETPHASVCPGPTSPRLMPKAQKHWLLTHKSPLLIRRGGIGSGGPKFRYGPSRPTFSSRELFIGADFLFNLIVVCPP
jgi:hypothetical protein